MNDQQLMALLRSSSEDDVAKALANSNVALPLDDAHKALEFFHCMLDVLAVAQKEAEQANSVRIRPGFGSTE